MYDQDDTQPIRSVQNEPKAPASPWQDAPPSVLAMEEDENSGPGCLIWSIVGGFTLILALVIVLMAGFAGWNDGLRLAQGNATATRSSDIETQCQRIEIELSGANTGLIDRRFEDLLLVTPAVACIERLAPTATAIFLQNQPTSTPSPSPTPEATMTLTQETLLEPTAEIPLAEPGSDSGFNLNALLEESRGLISQGRLLDAIDLLDAIRSIDTNFEKATVDQLLFNTLTTQANTLYQTGNLAQAILLTNRAEEFGDIRELNFERLIATLYLDAQANLNINYGAAIRLLSQIVYTYSAPNYRDAMDLLYGQYVAYGDALAIGGSACSAVTQYENSLQMRASSVVAAKRDSARTSCELGTTATPDPANPDAAAPQQQTPGGVAPIGVPGT